MHDNRTSKRLRILYSIIRLASPIELIDLSNLIFILEKEGILKLGYSDWMHVNGLGVISPILEVDIARLVYKGLIRVDNGVVSAVADNCRGCEDGIGDNVKQVIVRLKGSKEFLRNLALRYSRTSIVALKGNSSSNS